MRSPAGLFAALLLCPRLLLAGVPEPATAADADPDALLEEAAISANEPRYVAPTTRDRIGRVWVPVHLDGKGPFRMVLDTGAMHSAVTQKTAERMGLPLGDGRRVLVQGATGSAITPSIEVDNLSVGDLSVDPDYLPVVPYAFGGAEGLLGTDGMHDQRISIDFRRDRIDISRSRNRRAAPGYWTVRFLPDAQNLLVVRATIGGKTVRAIIDTGAHSTVGNLALQALLARQLKKVANERTEVHGATGAVQIGTGARVSTIRLGELVVMDAPVTFADLHLFNNWKMGDEPALLIGMDIIGLVEAIVIDYRRHELHIRPRGFDG
jgi:predicted aspartyl protease